MTGFLLPVRLSVSSNIVFSPNISCLKDVFYFLYKKHVQVFSQGNVFSVRDHISYLLIRSASHLDHNS